MDSTVTAEKLALVLDLLHRHGYRLRRLSADIIEVSDATAPAGFGRNEQAEETLEAEEYERDKWAHVGGKPAWLRAPGSRLPHPSADGEGA